MTLKSPFVWFGGKRRVAARVWAALGDVDNYIEPFAGSLAVLLGRPIYHKGTVETVNDKDGFVANFWRALSADPDAVAGYADWPVNECDLLARHIWLVNEGRDRLVALESDPEWHDTKVAGWWVWGLNSWIGSGWCSGVGPWAMGTAGQGVNRQLPHLGNAGRGVNRKRPHLGGVGGRGMGTNRLLLCQGNSWQGVLPKKEGLYSYLRALASRLREVRVCCGDWSRVVTAGAMSHGNTVGVFLDPPYLGAVRKRDLYSTDDDHVSTQVRDWALAHGDDRRLRIVLAGYEAEHAEEMERAGWTVMRYSASAAYQTARQAGGAQGNQYNRRQERLWFSPHCAVMQGTLL